MVGTCRLVHEPLDRGIGEGLPGRISHRSVRRPLSLEPTDIATDIRSERRFYHARGIAMRKLIVLIVLSSLLVFGCSRDDATGPESPGQTYSSQDADLELVAGEIVVTSGWEFDPEVELPETLELLKDQAGKCNLINLGREILFGDIAHYWWTIPVGCGEYDQIRLHRVVRERRPFRPIRSRKNIFMLHGDLKDFVGNFLPGVCSETYPNDFGIAALLAQADIDVWGLDHATTLVPRDATDLSFMSDWDLSKHARDARRGMAVARLVRWFTGSSHNKMNLLGYSGGSSQGFTVLNMETQLPAFRRHVKGFIPVDTGMLNDDSEYAQSNCGTVAYYEDLLAAGEYGEYSVFLLFGEPARDDPNGDSELWPPLTNLQAALALVSLPFDPVFPIHYWAVVFDEMGTPLGLQYTNVDLLIDFMTHAPTWLPTLYSKEIYLSHCTGGEPWTEHFAEIRNPIFWVSAQGGYAPWETYTLEQLGSTDVTMLNVQLHPAEEIELDYGHVDLFTADNAPTLVWQPILEWVQALGHHAHGENHLDMVADR